MLNVTVQLVSITNIKADNFDDGVPAEFPLIGQLLTREDGDKRLIILGYNKDGSSDEQVVEDTPDEVLPAFLVSIGAYQLVHGDLIEGADVRVLAELPSFEVDDAE